MRIAGAGGRRKSIKECRRKEKELKFPYLRLNYHMPQPDLSYHRAGNHALKQNTASIRVSKAPPPARPDALHGLFRNKGRFARTVTSG
jgi:hypothetical protein